jgi:hypothetical protein
VSARLRLPVTISCSAAAFGTRQTLPCSKLARWAKFGPFVSAEEVLYVEVMPATIASSRAGSRRPNLGGTCCGVSRNAAVPEPYSVDRLGCIYDDVVVISVLFVFYTAIEKH